MLTKLVLTLTKCQQVMIDETPTTRRNGQVVGPRTKAKSVNTNLHNNSFNNQIRMRYQVLQEPIVLVHISNSRSTQRMEASNSNKPDQIKRKIINKTQRKKEAEALERYRIIILRTHR